MNKITKKFLESEIDKVAYLRPVGTLIICDITTKDGFTFTGESACVGPTNFNQEIGEKIAYDDAFEKMWMPYEFWLHKALAEHEQRINGEGKPNETLVVCGSNANKYRKKPVVIEAIQFVELSRTQGKFAERIEYNDKAILDFVGLPLRVKTTPDVGNPLGKVSIEIPTLEGVMEAQVGDYVIKGVNGEFYPCKPDIFARTYEKVEHEQAPWSRQKMHDEAGRVGKNSVEDVLPQTKYMDFGQAVRVVKNGIRVCRDGWNGEGVFLILIKGEAVVECIKWRYGDPTPNGTLKVLDSIYMRTAQGDLVPWLPSQTDVLAEDWQIAN